MREGRAEPPAVQRADAQEAVCHGPRRDVPFREAQQLPRDPSGDARAGPVEVVHEQPRKDGQELRALGLPRAQLAGPPVGLPHLRGRPALGGDERPAQRDPQVELRPVAIPAGGQAGHELQGLRQLGHGFDHRRARHRPPPGLEPVADRLLRQARLGAVVGEQLGLRLRQLAGSAPPGRGRCGVELPPPVAQEACRTPRPAPARA